LLRAFSTVFLGIAAFEDTGDGTGSIGGWHDVELTGPPHAPVVAETSFNNMYERSSVGVTRARPPPSPELFSLEEVNLVASLASAEESKLNDKLVEMAAERRRQEVLAETNRQRVQAEAEADEFLAARQRREAEVRDNEAKRLEQQRTDAAKGRAEAKALAAKKQNEERERERRAAEAKRELAESEKYRVQREAEARVVAQAERDFDEKERRRKILAQMASGGFEL
jgi:hypothetical protein